MKVLLATDGSEYAAKAEQLAGSAAWPSGTRIDVLWVDELVPGDRTLPPDAYEALHERLHTDASEHLAQVKAALEAAGRAVGVTLASGRPATVIVDEARRIGTDLIVMGSRGRGQLASALLGSVAAEVVDHAHCPVLVARTATLSSAVLADDGSKGSRRAEETVVALPVFKALPYRVVSVAELAPWYLSIDAATGAAMGPEGFQQVFDTLQEDHARTAREAAARLAAQGVTATAETRSGPAAQGLIAAAADCGADVIVVGSRGRTGVRRAVLGSVARNVLFHAPCSVLVVHPPFAAAQTRGGGA